MTQTHLAGIQPTLLCSTFLRMLFPARVRATRLLTVTVAFLMFSLLLVSNAQAGTSLIAGIDRSFFAPNNPTATQLRGPGGVAVTSDGRVVITDTWNDRVLLVATDGKSIATLAGTGEPGAHLDANNPTNTQLRGPVGVAVTGDGRVVITDTENHRVLMVAADGQSISTLAGTGQPGVQLDANNPTNTQLNRPVGVAVTGDGRVVITDTGNNRVLFVGDDGLDRVLAGMIDDAKRLLGSGETKEDRNRRVKANIESLDHVIASREFIGQRYALSHAWLAQDSPYTRENSHLSLLSNETLEMIREQACNEVRDPMIIWRASIARRQLERLSSKGWA